MVRDGTLWVSGNNDVRYIRLHDSDDGMSMTQEKSVSFRMWDRGYHGHIHIDQTFKTFQNDPYDFNE